MTKSLGVVIPTYGRSEKIKQTLRALFQSDTGEIPLPIPVVVVDDGSTPPLESAIHDIEAPPAFSLRYIYQSNAGPGAARNTGYRNLEVDIVLFLDDDISLLPDSLLKHYRFHTYTAAQPCIYYGICPSIHEKVASTTTHFVPQLHIASGHLSMPKTLFPDGEPPYACNLKTPVAEEYELAYRLHLRQIPIYMDAQNIGIHYTPPLTLSYYIQREYRHGLALAELIHKKPNVLTMPPLPQLLKKHHPYRFRLSATWIIKSILAHTGLYNILGRIVEYFTPQPVSTESIWTKVFTGAAIMRGLKDGLSTSKQL